MRSAESFAPLGVRPADTGSSFGRPRLVPRSTGWPLTVLLVGYPLWWALGMGTLAVFLLAAAAAVAVAYLRVAMVLASAVGSATEAGTFAAAFRVVEVLSVVPFLAAGTVLPVLRRAAHADRGRYAATTRRALGGCAGLGLAATAALVVAAPLVIRIVAGPAFEAAVPVLRIEALALGLAFVNAAFGVALLSLHLHREMLTTALAGLVAVTAAALALAPSHGAQGAALASVIGESVWLATAALLVRRRGALLATRTAAASR
jgi:PST family polysaccharide transporter